MKRQYTAKEVAGMYSVSLASIYRKIEMGQLQSVRVKGRHMISGAEMKRHPESFWDTRKSGDDIVCPHCKKESKRHSPIHVYCSKFCRDSSHGKIKITKKRCVRCKRSRDRHHFNKQKQNIDGLDSWCKDCKKISQKDWEARNPKSRSGRNRKSRLKRHYGITMDQYDEMHRNQNGLCAICGEPEHHEGWHLSVDHDHNTMVVRGLLCHRCNKVLGMLKDNIEALESMVKYLQETKK